MVTVVKADRRTLLQVAAALRLEDRQEIERASGGTPEESLLKPLDLPGDVFVGYLGEVDASRSPFGAFGCHDGVVWLLCTDEVQRGKLSIFKAARKVLGEWLERYGRLYNYADCQNTLHIAWIRAMGFTLGEKVIHRGHEFRHFFMEKQPCVTP